MKHSKVVAMGPAAKTIDAVACAPLSVDHTHLMDHTSDADRRHDAERRQKLRAATAEIFVSCRHGDERHRGDELCHCSTNDALVTVLHC